MLGIFGHSMCIFKGSYATETPALPLTTKSRLLVGRRNYAERSQELACRQECDHRGAPVSRPEDGVQGH